SSRLRTMPYLVKTRTSGLRFRTLSRTYPFRPLMTETTDTTVATPMITPRRVKNERSLLRRSAWNATAKTSERGTSARGAGLRALLLLLDLDLVPFFQGPNRLEGAGDDLLPVGEPPRDLDLQLARQAELDRQEPRLPVLQDVDARFGLDASRRRLLPPGRVPHDARGGRDGERLRLGPGDDVRGDREARPDALGGMEQLDPHLEVDRVGGRDEPLELRVGLGDRRVLDLRHDPLESAVRIR